MPQVFISHSAADRAFVEAEILPVLHKGGIKPWYAERSIQSAEQWEQSIRKGLEQSDWFMVVMSPRSTASRWVAREVHWAVEERYGRVIPVLMEDCDLNAWHLGLRVLQYVDFRHDKRDARKKLLATWGAAPPPGRARTDKAGPQIDQTPGEAGPPEKGPNNALREIRRRGSLRVGCLSYPPFIDFTVKGRVVTARGLYARMLEHVAGTAGVGLEYSVLRWDTAIRAVTSRQVDLAVCVLQSRERRKSCDFCGTLYRVGVGGVVKCTQRKIRRHEDLKKPGVTVAVTKGEIGWEYAVNYLALEEQYTRFTVVEHTRITQMMNLVQTGEVDVAIADSLSCAQYIARSGGSLRDVFLKSPLHVEENSAMIAQNEPELKAWLTAGFKSARGLPKVQQLEQAIGSDYDGVLMRVDLV